MRAGKPLREQVMVITGATSGIGLATVRATAKAGAKLVLVARGQPDLREICAGIAADGALFVVADVLASKQAIAHFSELRPGSWMFFLDRRGFKVNGGLASGPVRPIATKRLQRCRQPTS